MLYEPQIRQLSVSIKKNGYGCRFQNLQPNLNSQTNNLKTKFNLSISKKYPNKTFNTYTASSQESVNTVKQYYHVIEDNISIYLTWMPQNLWDTSAFFAGIIQSICQLSGLECKVNSYSKLQSGENPMTEFQIKISQAENQRWKDNQ